MKPAFNAGFFIEEITGSFLYLHSTKIVYLYQLYRNSNRMLVIGIAGGTGSGKTTVVDKILQQLDIEGMNILSQDNYYHDNHNLTLTEREALNYDHPKSIDFELMLKHVKALKNNEPIEQPIYSFVTHSRTVDHVTVEPKNVLVVEGILVLTNKELLKEFDLKVFVHADSDERLIRRIRRDTQERGRDLSEVLHRYQTTLKPMHQEFIEPSKNEADLIIPNMKQNSVAIDFLTTVIKNSLRKH